MVPGRKQRADAERFVLRQRDKATLDAIGFAFQPGGNAAEVLQPFRDAAHLRAHLADRTAGHGRFERSEEPHPVAQQRGEAIEIPCALQRFQRLPRGTRSLRRCGRRGDVGCVGHRHPAKEHPRCGTRHLNAALAMRRAPFTAVVKLPVTPQVVAKFVARHRSSSSSAMRSAAGCMARARSQDVSGRMRRM